MQGWRQRRLLPPDLLRRGGHATHRNQDHHQQNTTRQTEIQTLDQGRSRSLDVYAQWAFSRTLSLRLFANNLTPAATWSQTTFDGGYGSLTERKSRTQFGAAVEAKL